MTISIRVKINIKKIMAKKSKSVKDAVCARCIGSFKFKELNRVYIQMHRHDPNSGYYGVYVCDKCEPKFELDRREPTQE